MVLQLGTLGSLVMEGATPLVLSGPDLIFLVLIIASKHLLRKGAGKERRSTIEKSLTLIPTSACLSPSTKLFKNPHCRSELVSLVAPSHPLFRHVKQRSGTQLFISLLSSIRPGATLEAVLCRCGAASPNRSFAAHPR